jgi:hypothetical protein
MKRAFFKMADSAALSPNPSPASAGEGGTKSGERECNRHRSGILARQNSRQNVGQVCPTYAHPRRPGESRDPGSFVKSLAHCFQKAIHGLLCRACMPNLRSFSSSRRKPGPRFVHQITCPLFSKSDRRPFVSANYARPAPILVVPAKAGTQLRSSNFWIPARAGMTVNIP